MLKCSNHPHLRLFCQADMFSDVQWVKMYRRLLQISNTKDKLCIRKAEHKAMQMWENSKESLAADQ